MTHTKAYAVLSASKSHQFEVFLAANDRWGKPVDVTTYQTHVVRVRRAVCALTGGGCTQYQANGYWGGVAEPTTVLRAWYSGAGAQDGAEQVLLDALAAYGVACDQEVVGFLLDGSWYVVRGGGA